MKKVNIHGQTGFPVIYCVLIAIIFSYLQLDKLIVGHDNQGRDPGWFLEEVDVDIPDRNERYVFKCGGWLADTEREYSEVVLFPGELIAVIIIIIIIPHHHYHYHHHHHHHYYYYYYYYYYYDNDYDYDYFKFCIIIFINTSLSDLRSNENKVQPSAIPEFKSR